MKDTIILNLNLSKKLGRNAALLYGELLNQHYSSQLDTEGYFQCTASDLRYHTSLGEKAQNEAIKQLLSVELIGRKSDERYFKINDDADHLKDYLRA